MSEIKGINKDFASAVGFAAGACFYTNFNKDAQCPTSAAQKMSELAGWESLGEPDQVGMTEEKKSENKFHKGGHLTNFIALGGTTEFTFKASFLETARASVTKLRYGVDAVEVNEDGSFKAVRVKQDAGQHGVATATAAALFNMQCTIFMGKHDTERQALNVYKMRLLGADVRAVSSGTATLKDAVNEALREWTRRIDDTHYCIGSVMGPHPFPTMVRDFQAVISKEIKEQMRTLEGKLPDAVCACVGGGSNAIGSFYHFINDPQVALYGCEAAGRGADSPDTAATLTTGSTGIFHGMKSIFCQDTYGQIAPVYSISAGLDYPGIGPEHAYLHEIGRAHYVPITDTQAVEAFEYLSKTEGIIPAIESAHALAFAMQLAKTMDKTKTIVVTISGRGDKDCAAIARYKGEDIHD